MNHLFYGVDQATHRRGLLVSLIAATLVSGIIVERAQGRLALEDWRGQRPPQRNRFCRS
jgi:hypothetical protein